MLGGRWGWIKTSPGYSGKKSQTLSSPFSLTTNQWTQPGKLVHLQQPIYTKKVILHQITH